VNVTRESFLSFLLLSLCGNCESVALGLGTTWILACPLHWRSTCLHVVLKQKYT